MCQDDGIKDALKARPRQEARLAIDEVAWRCIDGTKMWWNKVFSKQGVFESSRDYVNRRNPEHSFFVFRSVYIITFITKKINRNIFHFLLIK